MKIPFELEWLGGTAERYFRKIRPTAEGLPWDSLNPSDYSPVAVEYARKAWTEVAINEYRALASFCEVMHALVEVKAPLDLLGMTGDFLTDECLHVELASRMAMALGGAVPRAIDFDQFAVRSCAATPFQRANELVLRVSGIAEAFSGGTATVSYEETSHVLARSIYETILRDEAHHRRLAGLYFEWSLARIDDDERRRLGRVMLAALKSLAPFWKTRSAKHDSPSLPAGDLRALGWLSPIEFGPIARDVVVSDILDPLSTIGIAISAEDRSALLDSSA